MQQLGVVVDRSGSMASMRSELVEGLNVFMEEQRKVGPAKEVLTVTVMEFDSVVNSVLDSVDLAQVPKFGDEHFQPRGMTALLDGIGSMIETIGSSMESHWHARALREARARGERGACYRYLNRWTREREPKLQPREDFRHDHRQEGAWLEDHVHGREPGRNCGWPVARC